MKLSQHRAESVTSYLADHFGIVRSRLKAVGYGDTRPLADNRTEEGKRRNRRIGAVVACATDIDIIKDYNGLMEIDANVRRIIESPEKVRRGNLALVAAVPSRQE